MGVDFDPIFVGSPRISFLSSNFKGEGRQQKRNLFVGWLVVEQQSGALIIRFLHHFSAATRMSQVVASRSAASSFSRSRTSLGLDGAYDRERFYFTFFKSHFHWDIDPLLNPYFIHIPFYKWSLPLVLFPVVPPENKSAPTANLSHPLVKV